MKEANLFARRDLLVSIAKMYYIEGRTQQEIADTVHLSRSNISRMLKLCVEQKIIEFYVNETTSVGYEMRNELLRRYALKDVIIVPSKADEQETKLALAQATAAYLPRMLKTGMLMGVAWGTTLYKVALAIRKLNDSMHVDVIQLVGGVGAQSADTNGLEIAKIAAESLNGNAHFAFVPYLVQNEKLKELLLQETDVAAHFARMQHIDIALVGIGSSQRTLSSSVRAGYISDALLEELVRDGAVADICGMQIDASGNLCAHEFNKRRMGIEYDSMKRIDNVIGVACGARKADAIQAALKSGLVSILAVDEEAASKVIEQ